MNLATYSARKLAGKCCYSTTCETPASPGMVTCLPHRQAQLDYQRGDGKRAHLEASRAFRKRARRLGLCQCCGTEPAWAGVNAAYCESCARRRTDYYAARKKAARVRAPESCSECGRPGHRAGPRCPTIGTPCERCGLRGRHECIDGAAFTRTGTSNLGAA